MAKVIALLLVACAAGWYYFIGGAQLDEAMVRQFYAAEAHATLSRDPEALCKLLSSKLRLTQETLIGGQSTITTLNQKEACEAQRNAFKQFEEMGEKADGILTIEYDYNIDKLEIAPNRKTAFVQVSSTLKMGEALMQFRSISENQLNREWGVVHYLKGDVKTKVRMNAAAMLDPGKYLQEQ